MKNRIAFCSTAAVFCSAFCILPSALVLASAPTTQVGNLPHIQVDAAHHQVRIDCFAVNASYPLEFVLVHTDTNEYESLLRTDAKPSDLHLALLMIGLKPGSCVHYDDKTKTTHPPTGPLVNLRVEYDENNKHIDEPAYAWMRDVNTNQPATAYTWCFAGSYTANGTYAADETGSFIGVINNPLSVLDVPALKSRALDARQWQRNPAAMPPTGTPVTLVLTPATPTTQRNAD